MNFLIKSAAITSVFFISSCNIIYPITLDIAESFYKQKASLHLHKTRSTIIELQTDHHKNYFLKKGSTFGHSQTWISSSGKSIIVSLNGKIIKTSGLEHNIDIRDNFNPELIIMMSNPIYKAKADILLLNPSSGYLEQELEYSLMGKGDGCDCQVLKEEFEVPSIGWSGTNLYWLDNDYNVIKSEQLLHPDNPSYKIKYP